MAAFKNKPPRCASPILKDLFNAADQQNITGKVLAYDSGVSKVCLSKWRHGVNTPSVMAAEELAHVLGLRLVAIPEDMDFIVVPKGTQFRRYAR